LQSRRSFYVSDSKQDHIGMVVALRNDAPAVERTLRTRIHTMSNLKTILHPTDFSPSASEALLIAGSLARESGAKLILLYVAPRPVSNVGGMLVPPPPPPTADWSGLKAELDAMTAGVQGVSVQPRLVEGEPASTIVDLARETGADMIVIGSHGRTGVSRLLMGSVAEHVVRMASCPVLTVKSHLK
jgi:nucleotide-binding universal stress UspA family protein